MEHSNANGLEKPTTIVLLDVDGVVADLVSVWLRQLRAITGQKFTPDDVTEWNIGKALGVPHETAECVWDILRRPEAHNYIHPYPGVRAAVSAIHDTGVTVYFVTHPLSAAPTWCYDRSLWLQEHCGYSAAVYTSHKHLIDGDVLIEDSLHEARAWVDGRRDRTSGHCAATAFLINQPWNQGTVGEGIIRIGSLSEAVRHIRDIQADGACLKE